MGGMGGTRGARGNETHQMQLKTFKFNSRVEQKYETLRNISHFYTNTPHLRDLVITLINIP